MQELQDQLELLNQQVINIGSMMRAKVKPYWVNDSKYVKDGIEVTINHGYEDYDWTMYTNGTVYAQGYDQHKSYWVTLWELLHGTYEEPDREQFNPEQGHYHPEYDFEG